MHYRISQQEVERAGRKFNHRNYYNVCNSQRISAEWLLGASDEFHSDDNMSRLGLREVECTCPPGTGHNAPRG